MSIINPDLLRILEVLGKISRKSPKLLTVNFNFMKSTDLNYIQENFIEKEAVLKHFTLDESELDNLIKHKIIPGPSYSIETKTKITSPLNDFLEETFTDDYFPKSILKKIETYLQENTSFETGKADFKKNFKNLLLNHKDREFAYDNIFDGNEIDANKFNTNFEEEWNFHIAGGYGICTLNATEHEIVEKEIAVKKLKQLYEKTKERDLNQTEIRELILLNEQFNKVAALFAPYQRINSSRGKYLDYLLKKAKRSDDIKNYG